MFTQPPYDSDRSFTAWLERDANVRPPDALLEQVLARTAATRRRPGWLVIERWFPMHTTARFGAIPRAAMLLLILGVALALATATVIGAQPSPYPPGPGVFEPAASLTEARTGHTSVLLHDGRVLVVGGAYADAVSPRDG